MAKLWKLGYQYTIKSPFVFFRNISVSGTHSIKEINEIKKGKEIVIEGVFTSSPREKLLVKPNPVSGDKKPCSLCALELDVKHTDVLILSQFVRSDGCMLPKRITGLCSRQQKKIGTMVTMAQKAGLMMNLTPAYSKKDPKKRYQFKKFNTYYDETTIFNQWCRPRLLDRFKR